METVLLVFELLVAIALIVIVLLQRSEGGALGIGGGGGGGGIGGLFSPRGAASTLTRLTAILGALFLASALGLTLLALGGKESRSILDSPPETAPSGPAPGPSQPAPAEPQVPEVPTDTTPD